MSHLSLVGHSTAQRVYFWAEPCMTDGANRGTIRHVLVVSGVVVVYVLHLGRGMNHRVARTMLLSKSAFG